MGAVIPSVGLNSIVRPGGGILYVSILYGAKHNSNHLLSFPLLAAVT